MPFDLITTIPLGFVVALAVKQLYTMILGWVNQPTVIVQEIVDQVLNRTIAIRNTVVDVAVFVFGGALEILNSAKELVLHIVGGVLQEVVRILHLIVHIVKQGFLVIRNVYNIIIASLETFYLALKSINDFFWFIVEGSQVVVSTVVSAPGRAYDYVNTTLTTFVEDQVVPAVNWFLYGPKISNTRYYILVLVLVGGFAAWNSYQKYKQRKNSAKKEKSA
jgi:phage-related protein